VHARVCVSMHACACEYVHVCMLVCVCDSTCLGVHACVGGRNQTWWSNMILSPDMHDYGCVSGQ